jgi:hypothetical protein
MGVELRRYPRIPFTERGALEVPVTYADPDAGSLRIAARFHDISCQGAEIIVAPNDSGHVVPGTTVQLVLPIDDGELQIPARVVWTASSKVGLRLRLGSASDDIRRSYADWIVPRTNKAIAQAKAAARGS